MYSRDNDQQDGQKEQKEWGRKFWGKIVLSIIVLPIVMWIWPGVVPFTLVEFWSIRGTSIEWLQAVWPMFAWGAGFTFIHALFTRNDRNTNRHAEKIIVGGTLVSILAGVVEEITFRWLFFLSNIVSVKIANFFFFGFLGFGVAEWFHLNAFGPIANFTTLHFLEPYIFHSTGWAVGAAMLTTNAFFRDGHKYQGPIGWINSWFMGMILFWVMFQYGLPVAILVHFTYDFLIFAVHYADAAMERAQGHT